MTQILRKAGQRINKLILVPLVLPLLVLWWSGVKPPPEPSVLEEISFGRINELVVTVQPYTGPHEEVLWLVNYDITGERYLECPGGLDSKQTVYSEDGVQAFPTHVLWSPEPRTGIGVATFTTIELPLLLPLVPGTKYQLQVEVSCLDRCVEPTAADICNDDAPGPAISLPARSPRVLFMTGAAPVLRYPGL